MSSFQSRQIREKQEDVMSKIRDATVKIPKPPEPKVIKKQEDLLSVYR